MLVIYHGETPLVNCGPRSILLHLNTNLLQSFTSCIFLQVTIIFHTIRLILKPVRLTTSLLRWGKVSWLCCAGPVLKSYLFDNLGFFSEGKLAATLIIPSSWGFPTDVWSACIKHFFWRRCRGFEAPLLRRFSSPINSSFLGCSSFSCTVASYKAPPSTFSGAIAIKLLQGESHTSNLFTFLLSCLVYFYFMLFVSFIKNRKK